jgi:guanosine-diphosphatase
MGYEFADEREVRIEKKVGGTELGWCLGATIELVGGKLTCNDDDED